MHKFISTTAKWGDLISGPRVVNKATKKEMKKILEEIQSGKFARRWIAENKSGLKTYNRLMKADMNHDIEKVGVKLRERMPWLQDERA
jgi:ketol-acid reductoisomerase